LGVRHRPIRGGSGPCGRGGPGSRPGPASDRRVGRASPLHPGHSERNQMKGSLVLAAITAAALSLGVGVASPSTNAANAATVSHYTASYSCDCFGTFTIVGVHVTNQHFSGS